MRSLRFEVRSRPGNQPFENVGLALGQMDTVNFVIVFPCFEGVKMLASIQVYYLQRFKMDKTNAF